MKAIIFDMDGLMIDTERLYFKSERVVAKSFGKDVSETTLGKMMGRKPLEAIEIFIEDLGIQSTPHQVLEMRDKLFLEMLEKDLVPMQGLFEMLDDFKGKMMLAIATGSPRKFVDKVIHKLKIHEYFDAYQTADETVNGKPHPEVFIKTVHKLKLSANECIVLEDSSNGALAAKNAGCYTIAVPSVYTKEQDFSFVDHKAANLNDVRDYIKNKFLI